MKKISLLLFSILLSASLSALAKQDKKIIFHNNIISVPSQSKLAFNPEKSGKLYGTDIAFTGEMAVTGILQIYWMATWPEENDPGKEPFMRFFPDKQSLAKLPTVQENSLLSQPRIINLTVSNINNENEGKFSEEKIRELLKDSQNLIPETFFKYKERYTLVPVSLFFSDLISYKECDARFFNGTFIGMERDSKFATTSKDELENQFGKIAEGCAEGTPYDELFNIEAKFGNKIEVRSSPDIKSSVSSNLENGILVLKLKTINDDWLYIKATPDRAPRSHETESNSVFGYIHTPDLKLDIVN